MAIDSVISATRRRNVSPTSSILRIVTRDVDCSGAGFTYAPEDGQFVCTAGEAATNPYGTAFFGANAGAVDATDAQASSLKMVWSSALQTDRQALGNTKVPVLWLGGVEVECKLLNYDSANATLATAFPAGTLVSVKAASAAVQGTANRLVITPMAAGDIGWAVGYVTKSHTSLDSGSDAPANDKGVTIMLYDQARKIGETST